MTTVLASGYFDPLHDGHRSHFREAAKLCDKLIVVIHQDRLCARKKGFCHQPLEERIVELKKALKDIPVPSEVVICIDPHGPMTATLLWLRPNIFAKGGDRSPDQHPIPQDEIDACNEIGCRIVYNVGEPKRPEWSSTKIALEERARNGLQ